jgi:hypothetical protein
MSFSLFGPLAAKNKGGQKILISALPSAARVSARVALQQSSTLCTSRKILSQSFRPLGKLLCCQCSDVPLMGAFSTREWEHFRRAKLFTIHPRWARF